MIYIAYFVFTFSILQFLIAIVNMLFNQRYISSGSKFSGLVSVLIPVRNEEKNIGNLLNDLIHQDYINIEILVFNDLSTDETANIVLNYSKLDSRIKLINSDGLPFGWLGKNYACHTLSENANGEYLLFLDADVHVGSGIIIESIGQSRKFNLGLLSIFPMQIIKSFGERITVPNMNYILLSLLPLIFVRTTKFKSLAAANGQFMLFNASGYKHTLPHEKMKASRVEDIEIARYYKQKFIKVACLAGNKTIQCKMYNGFFEAVNGFSKNVITFFGNYFVVAILFLIITSFGFIPIWYSFPFNICVIYLLILLLTRITISIVSKQNILLNLVLFIPQQISFGMFIYKALHNKISKNYQWKGRSIS